MTRDEAQGWLAQTLLDKIRNDPYPSATQMALVEEVIPREMVPDYLQALIDKVAQDDCPSIPMLKRIARVAETLPRSRER